MASNNMKIEKKKMSFLVEIENYSGPKTRLDLEISCLEDLIHALTLKFGPLRSVSYYDRDFKEFCVLEDISRVGDKTKLQISIASNSKHDNLPETFSPMIDSPNSNHSTDFFQNSTFPKITSDVISPGIPMFQMSNHDSFNSPDIYIDQFDNLGIDDTPSPQDHFDSPVPTIISLIRGYQVSGDRNVSPPLTIALPSDLSPNQEIKVAVVDAVDGTEIENGFSSGNVQLANKKTALTFKSLKFGKKESFPSGEVYKVYKIKVVFPNTSYEPIFSNPFILLSNPTRQLPRKEVLELAEKWGIKLDSGLKRHKTESEPFISNDNTNDKYSWTEIFNCEVKTTIPYSQFESSLINLFSKKFGINPSKEILQIIEYFLNNMPPKYRPEQPNHISSIQWDLLLKFYGPLPYMLHKIIDVYQQLCFHGYMTSADATEILKGKPGHFLIRYSESEFGMGNYAVTVNRGTEVGHDRIEHYATKHYPETHGFIFNNKLYYSMKDFIKDHPKVLAHPLLRHINLDSNVTIHREDYEKYKADFESDQDFISQD